MFGLGVRMSTGSQSLKRINKTKRLCGAPSLCEVYYYKRGFVPMTILYTILIQMPYASICQLISYM